MKRLLLNNLLLLISICVPNLVFSAAAPIATTFSATSITGSSVTLNGRISANGADTSVTFEYGTTTAYGNTIAATPSTITGSVNTPVVATISGLSLNTLYHYRVNGVNSAGTSLGNDLSFTTTPCDTLKDGSFESGTPNIAWTETSTNFDTPLCDIATCGNSGSARTGNFWAWFGGIPNSTETGSLTQTVLIPSESLAHLNFYLRNPVSSGNGTDFLKVTVDGNTVFNTLAGNPLYTDIYTLVDVDLKPYADNGCHTLHFESTTYSNTGFTSIFVDDVAVPYCSPVLRNGSDSFTSIQTAMNAAGNGSIITATAQDFIEDPIFSQSGRVTLKGGYDCLNSKNLGYTTISGKLTVNGTGTLVAERLIIR